MTAARGQNGDGAAAWGRARRDEASLTILRDGGRCRRCCHLSVSRYRPASDPGHLPAIRAGCHRGRAAAARSGGLGHLSGGRRRRPHYRFDPDGYARFGSDARLGPDSWEVVCVSWPEPDCTGRRGALVLTVAADGHPDIRVAGATEAARFRLGWRDRRWPDPGRDLHAGAPPRTHGSRVARSGRGRAGPPDGRARHGREVRALGREQSCCRVRRSKVRRRRDATRYRPHGRAAS
jgi:hypothetical protein